MEEANWPDSHLDRQWIRSRGKLRTKVQEALEHNLIRKKSWQRLAFLTVKPHPKPLRSHALPLLLHLQKCLLLLKPLQSLSTQTIPITKLHKPISPKPSVSLMTSIPTTSPSKKHKNFHSQSSALPHPHLLSPPTTQTQKYVSYVLLGT